MRLTLEPGQSSQCPLGHLKAGQTLRLLLNLEQPSPGPLDRVTAELTGPGIKPISKEMHAGDPDWFLTCRPSSDGPVAVTLTRGNDSVRGSLSVARSIGGSLPLAESERTAIEAEPNDRWQDANPLQLGRDVYGTADDVDYLANTNEGKCGLDWFKFEVQSPDPVLVYFQLDLLDRDVSANLRVYTVDPKSGGTRLYLAGKDPMEIVHDRERERYSKHISRTFTRGTYYLEVNANHPDYILRTRVLPVPPYNDPARAVEAGMHYIMNVGDAWFAQVPRAGNIFIRADNIHDTGTRCTACHAAELLDRGQPGSPPQRLSDPLEIELPVRDGPDRKFDNSAVRRRRLCWQRFIATPLQAQGEQGGILADFEREVSGRPKPIVERFGPFLKAAWENRRDLPPDEQNAVIPLDSKFGFAWRDMRLLNGDRRSGPATPATRGPRPILPEFWANGPPTSGSKRSRTGSTGSTPGG